MNAPATHLDRYRRISTLGSGGMSTVDLAEDTLLGRRVALKRMHAPDDVRGHIRLRREALVGASLSHPNLVSIFDILTTEDGEDVIVMEYVDGKNLADALRSGARPGVAPVLEILGGVSAALDAIHAQGIVHRDVKPANILLGVDGSIKLADLGIAAVADRTQITTDGTLIGTFSYMAPEQLEGAAATPAVDVYALSAVAFEALSGQRARDEPNPVAIAHAISTQPPPDLGTAWPEAPAAAAEVVKRGMSRDPEERPRSAGELTARLKQALEPEPTAPIGRRAAPVRAAAAGAAAGVAGAGAAAAAAEKAGAGRSRPRPADTPKPIALSREHRRGEIAPPPARARSTPPRRSGGGVLAAVALALAAIAAAAIVIASSGGGSNRSATNAAKSRAKSHKSSSGPSAPASHTGSASTATQQSGSSSGIAAPSVGGAGAGSPITAVESFYHLAAAHQYSSAWALADPAFRNQLGGYPSFQTGQAGDRSITFNGAAVRSQSPDAATVFVRTTSVRDNGTQHCYGPVNVVRGTSGWVLDHIDINCTS